MRALRKLGSLAALRKELGAVPPRTVLRQDGGAALPKLASSPLYLPCISMYLTVSSYISPGAAIPKLASLVAATIGALQLALPLNLPLALHP